MNIKAQFVPEYKIEYKGLDLVRRDWSRLTKEASKEVIQILFSNGGLDGVYNFIGNLNMAIDNFKI
jgi:DNA polymerase elongation subunit (family B)